MNDNKNFSVVLECVCVFICACVYVLYVLDLANKAQ